MDEPFFKEVVEGAFVRISLGHNAQLGRSIYRLCQIEGAACGCSLAAHPDHS